MYWLIPMMSFSIFLSVFFFFIYYHLKMTISRASPIKMCEIYQWFLHYEIVVFIHYHLFFPQMDSSRWFYGGKHIKRKIHQCLGRWTAFANNVFPLQTLGKSLSFPRSQFPHLLKCEMKEFDYIISKVISGKKAPWFYYGVY